MQAVAQRLASPSRISSSIAGTAVTVSGTPVRTSTAEFQESRDQLQTILSTPSAAPPASITSSAPAAAPLEIAPFQISDRGDYIQIISPRIVRNASWDGNRSPHHPLNITAFAVDKGL